MNSIVILDEVPGWEFDAVKYDVVWRSNNVDDVGLDAMLLNMTQRPWTHFLGEL